MLEPGIDGMMELRCMGSRMKSELKKKKWPLTGVDLTILFKS